MFEIGFPRIALDHEEPKLAKLTDSATVCVVRIGLKSLLEPDAKTGLELSTFEEKRIARSTSPRRRQQGETCDPASLKLGQNVRHEEDIQLFAT